ncbi:hypothetical protein HU71_004801 [Salmonella enterica subsp. enterica]|nr:hypothetical protein [Salmonella enterica subsp. enterica]
MKIFTDCWNKGKNNEYEAPLINKEQLLSSIKLLDGKNKTTVNIEIDDETNLLIGGGNEGLYVVTGNKDNKIYTALSDVNPGSDFTHTMIIGGQYTPIEIKYCVNKEMACQAAAFFFEENDFDPQLNWEIL